MASARRNQIAGVTPDMPSVPGSSRTTASWTPTGSVRAAGDSGAEREILEKGTRCSRQPGWLLDLTLDLAEKSGEADETTLAPVGELGACVEAIKNKNDGT